MWLLKDPIVVLWNEDSASWVSVSLKNDIDIGDALCMKFSAAMGNSEWTHCIEIDMKTMRKYRSALKYAAKLKDNLLNDWKKVSPQGGNFDE